MKLNEFTIKEVVKGLEEKRFSSLDVTKDCLNSIKKQEKDLNAFITVTEELVLKQAKESDSRRAKGGTLSTLDGVPVAIKDNMAVKDFPTTAGSKILEDFVPSYDAFVVQKLKESGAVIIGKTNMDEFAMGSSTESSHFGSTKNPHDLERVPGGSSGGSAVAVAADEAICALGSDTGGSIRQPASFCGVVGFKPTYGAVSRNGLFAMASSLDQIGPITKTVEDAEILFENICDYDKKDSTSNEKGIETVGKNNGNIDLKNLKVGVLKDGFGDGVEDGVKKNVVETVERLKKEGAIVEEIDIEVLKYALAVYYVLMPVEVSSNLGRYDGIKYGYSVEKEKDIEIKNLLDVYSKSRTKGFGAEAKRRIILGAYASSAGYIDQYYLQAKKVAVKIRQEFDKIFENYDVIISPTAPTTAFKLGEKSDPLSMYLGDIFTVPANIAGLPSISIPCGKVDGLPVGLQITGQRWEDKKVLSIARAIEKVISGQE
ncbi:Asp-tRNA(Asn)/Glu-tRNA(Gln) amidotransferase GatCAB subunit A [bacterium (Candidatus Howlettbacteria) CG_4_10_14_0_8_um_filter_40_9]|nr:MAG: Asp-tRNA(Asn)/Glu-tRNA(Gln) amidotransferase GatCAB subunit A [bacterium (Candidatus Howlettbacteria) CG_4_10_14_0_8_um_filter_40_9]